MSGLTLRLAVLVSLVAPTLALAVACSSFSGADPVVGPDAADDQAAVQVDAAVSTDAPAPPADGADPDAGTPSSAGCSDGTREAFLKVSSGIAGCEGAWSLPGIPADGVPSCKRASGNSGANKTGAGCAAEDLCASGWHVCRDATDVGGHGGSAPGEPCSTSARDGGTFYATGQPSAGNAVCAAPGSAGVNDIFGCGDVGSQPDGNCSPLNVFIGQVQVSGFYLGTSGNDERAQVIKSAGPGGVLCCQD